jgi:hypothetical protein
MDGAAQGAEAADTRSLLAVNEQWTPPPQRGDPPFSAFPQTVKDSPQPHSPF